MLVIVKKQLTDLKVILRRVINWCQNQLFRFTLPLFVRYFKRISTTGYGTDLCLKQGFLPLPIHYYSPVPDICDLEKRKIWNKKSSLEGINFQAEKQIQLMNKLGKKYGNECNWPDKPLSIDSPIYYTENSSFSFGCSAALHSIIREYQPKRILEIGSGFSSLVISSAVAMNKDDGINTVYTIIDPYPTFVSEHKVSNITKLIRERVEMTDIDHFSVLNENDILFIDSGHTVRTGSDVNFLYLEVLPRLAPGVLIHIHDISLPYEYPQVYFTNPAFRVFWTEAYLLQAFLAFNTQFEILMALGYLMTDHKNEFKNAFPYYDPNIHKAISGSFWIRKINNN